jgi:hypothetical protein
MLDLSIAVAVENAVGSAVFISEVMLMLVIAVSAVFYFIDV